MTEFEALQQRMNQAAGQLATVLTTRQQECKSLMDTLGQLEQRFNEREVTLNEYRAKIAPMEQENRHLSEMLGKLLVELETDFSAEPSQDIPAGLRPAASTMTAASTWVI